MEAQIKNKKICIKLSDLDAEEILGAKYHGPENDPALSNELESRLGPLKQKGPLEYEIELLSLKDCFYDEIKKAIIDYVSQNIKNGWKAYSAYIDDRLEMDENVFEDIKALRDQINDALIPFRKLGIDIPELEMSNLILEDALDTGIRIGSIIFTSTYLLFIYSLDLEENRYKYRNINSILDALQEIGEKTLQQLESLFMEEE